MTKDQEPKHTPGPWRMEVKNGYITIYGKDDEIVIADWDINEDSSVGISVDYDKEIANFYLIASAPTQQTEIEGLETRLQKALAELKDATAVGTPYWRERDAMNALIVNNLTLTAHVERLREIGNKAEIAYREWSWACTAEPKDKGQVKKTWLAWTEAFANLCAALVETAPEEVTK